MITSKAVSRTRKGFCWVFSSTLKRLCLLCCLSFSQVCWHPEERSQGLHTPGWWPCLPPQQLSVARYTLPPATSGVLSVKIAQITQWPKSCLPSHGSVLTTSWLDNHQRNPEPKERTSIFCLAVLNMAEFSIFKEDIWVLFMVSKSRSFSFLHLKKTKKKGIPYRTVRKHGGLWSMRLKGRKALWESPVIENWLKKCKCHWCVDCPP